MEGGAPVAQPVPLGGLGASACAHGSWSAFPACVVLAGGPWSLSAIRGPRRSSSASSAVLQSALVAVLGPGGRGCPPTGLSPREREVGARGASGRWRWSWLVVDIGRISKFGMPKAARATQWVAKAVALTAQLKAKSRFCGSGPGRLIEPS